MSLCDAYVAADGSAASVVQPKRPTADAVWVDECVRGSCTPRESYFRTRNAGIAHITGVLTEHGRERRRVLVGFDFPYGYPAGFTAALALPQGCPWWAIWAELADRVHDGSDKVNDRFAVAGDLNTLAGNGVAGPFWGCPTGATSAALRSRSPGFPFRASREVLLRTLRMVEERLPGAQEAWKLYGNGSGGSQALVGIPYVYRLRRDLGLAHVSRVWPFETNFTAVPSPPQGPFVLHAEICPGVVGEATRNLMAVDAGLIRDCAQVRAMCAWAAERDERDMLGHLFDTPNGLNPEQAQVCVDEEGWVLGAA